MKGEVRGGEGKRGSEERVREERARRALPALEASEGLFVVRLSLRPEDVVFVKGILEASEGLACLFAEKGGELTLATPPPQAAELETLVRDLLEELGPSACLLPSP